MLTSIRTVLTLMFAILAVVTGLQGAITYGRLVSAEHDVDSVAELQLASLNAIRNISNAFLRVGNEQLRLVLSEEINEAIESNAAALQAEQDELQAARRRYEPLIASKAERDIYDRMSSSLDGYLRLAAPLPKLMLVGQTETAKQLLLRPWLRVLHRTADAQLQNAVRLIDNRARDNVVAGVDALTRAKLVALVSALSAAGLAVLATLVSYWRILGPLGTVTRTLKQLAAGNIEADHVLSQRKDEIGAIGRAVEVFRTSLIRTREAESERLKTQLFVQNIAASTPDGVIAFDDEGCLTFWNQAAEALLGVQAAWAPGSRVDELLGAQSWLAVGPSDASADRQGTFETEVPHRDGHRIPVEISYSRWAQEDRIMSCAILRDIRARKRDEAVLHRLAHTDVLTDLPNRIVLMSRMGAALADHRPFALLMLDLDHFKQVNDAFGHQVGDGLLKLAAQRLLTCVDDTDTVARIGGDEFMVLLNDGADPLAAAATAGRIVQRLGEPFAIDGHTIHLGASIGMALSPSHGRSSDELVTCADIALYAAKAQGRHSYRLFTADLRSATVRDSLCRQELPRAYEENEFVLFYQPQVRLTDGTLSGAEALIRWNHPEFGLLAPDKFVHVLESSHLAEDVGNWVIRTACRQAVEWRRIWPDFRIGVNLSGAHFRSGRLAETVRGILAECGLPASALEVEITEHVILRHDDKMIAPLRELHQLGVSIAFDDYGTGYASLSFLKRFPLSRLKIDRGFVRNMGESPEDAAIIRTILMLGESLGLGVIAEGIETEEQAERLRLNGCTDGQGYFYGRPMPAAAFQASLSSVAPHRRSG